jgi:hypothetical protein
MAKFKPSEQAKQEIAELVKGFQFVVGNEDHIRIQESLGKLLRMISHKKPPPRMKEDIRRLKDNIKFIMKQ